MRELLLLMLIAGCGNDGAENAHRIVACDGRWTGLIGNCELACANLVNVDAGADTCVVMTDAGDTCGAAGGQVAPDMSGCCMVEREQGPYVVRLEECR
jgi:hypothetical protein